MEEERKWDELNKDCLVDILARVGTEALAVSIPFVCKSWYGATLDPRCWNSLVFPRFSSPEFIKFAVGCSQGSVTSIVFNYNCPEQGLEHISAGCPFFKVLNLALDLEGRIGPSLGDHIAKWNNLEKLVFCSSPSIKHVKSIGIHCKKFVELDCSFTDFDDQDVQDIVEFLPNIKTLNLSYSTLYGGQRISILRGCRDLDHLNKSKTFLAKLKILVLKYASVRKLVAIIERYIGRPQIEKNAGIFVVDLEGRPSAHYYDIGLAQLTSGIKVGDHLYCGSLVHPYIIRHNVTKHPADALMQIIDLRMYCGSR